MTPEWPFTNNWLVQQNESLILLPGIGTKFKQIHSPEFPLGQGYAPGRPTRLLSCPLLLTLLPFPFLLGAFI